MKSEICQAKMSTGLLLSFLQRSAFLQMMIIHDVQTSQASSWTSWMHDHLVYNRLLKFNHVVGVGQFYGSPALTYSISVVVKNRQSRSNRLHLCGGKEPLRCQFDKVLSIFDDAIVYSSL
ncbi:hypothetical protein Bca4012_049860 [Brassica carinata]